MAATMASAMPVLPLVASINVSPGLISPRRSAPMIMESAGRSFTEPAGLLPSSFARTTFVVFPGTRCRRTSGVLPTKRSRVGRSCWRVIAALSLERKAPRSAGLLRASRSLLFLLVVLLVVFPAVVLLRVFLRVVLLRVFLRLVLLRVFLRLILLGFGLLLV